MNNECYTINNWSVIQIVGPNGAGKTLFACRLLSSKKAFPFPIKEIHWHSGIKEGEAGETLERLKKLKQVHFNFAFPKGWMDKPQKHDAIVIDDLFEEANKEATTFNQLFTKVARHREVTVLFLTQNLFHQGGKHRTRNINTHYLVLFKNPRDKTVIDYIARQAYPNNRKFLMNAYHDATDDKPHGYLFLDFTQQCPESLRVKTDIFNKKYGSTIYKQETKKKKKMEHWSNVEKKHSKINRKITSISPYSSKITKREER